MKINIETYGSNKFDEISAEYGEILSRFELSKKEDGSAEIYIGTLGDIFNLHKEIEKFFDNSDQPLPYFGLMIKSNDGGAPYLEIKDNYD